MDIFQYWIKSLQSEDPIDLLPTILIVVLVSCILFCIVWMIVSLVRKRSHARYLRSQREATVAAFFSNDNLRVVEAVYTPSGDALGKLSSYQPILYSVKIEPFDPNIKTCKPLSVELLDGNDSKIWVHMMARMPYHSYECNRTSMGRQFAAHGPTSRLKFASLICKLNTPTILQ